MNNKRRVKDEGNKVIKISDVELEEGSKENFVGQTDYYLWVGVKASADISSADCRSIRVRLY